MVIPWIGFPVKKLLDKFQPSSDARYVEFKTLHRPSEMRGQRSFFSNIDWPYVEGLRLDEANHPLAIFAVGMYGKLMPNQNGAPIRLVVPWKYGFKSIKSIVEIRLTRRQPRNTWNVLQPSEYGFYANVNPNVDHPRWSQASERGSRRRCSSRTASRRGCSTAMTTWRRFTRGSISPATTSEMHLSPSTESRSPALGD